MLKHIRHIPRTALLIIVGLLILDAIGSIYLYSRLSDGGAAAADARAAKSQSWKTYCSDYGQLCLRYPVSWKLNTVATTDDEAVSPVTTRITSPSKDIIVIYRPNYGLTNQTESDILSVIGVANTQTADLRTVTLMTEYNGGGIVDQPFMPEAFVTNNLQAATTDTFVEGATITSNREPVFHTFTPRNNDKLTSYLYIKYGQNNPYKSDAGHYTTYDEASTMLKSSEARTAQQILQSARYK